MAFKGGSSVIDTYPGDLHYLVVTRLYFMIEIPEERKLDAKASRKWIESSPKFRSDDIDKGNPSPLSLPLPNRRLLETWCRWILIPRTHPVNSSRFKLNPAPTWHRHLRATRPATR